MSGMIQPARASGMPSAYRPAPARPGRFGQLNWYRVVAWSFLFAVIVPTAFTALYYVFLAAPQYQASVRLAVYAIGKDAGEAAAEFDSAGPKKDKSKEGSLEPGASEPRAGGARLMRSGMGHVSSPIPCRAASPGRLCADASLFSFSAQSHLGSRRRLCN